MTQLVLFAAVAAQAAASAADAPRLPQEGAPFQVQFSHSIAGRTVAVLLDGRIRKQSFAGKLILRDRNAMQLSVCADVRAPVARGQVFVVKPRRTQAIGGNVALAGHIVARHFGAAKNADQCAGLQLAVWEAVEDGGPLPNFGGGRFQAAASPTVIAYAQQYYRAVEERGDALFLQAGNGNGQSQLTAFQA